MDPRQTDLLRKRVAILQNSKEPLNDASVLIAKQRASLAGDTLDDFLTALGSFVEEVTQYGYRAAENSRGVEDMIMALSDVSHF